MCLLSCSGCQTNQQNHQPAPTPTTSPQSEIRTITAMKLSSPAFKPNDYIPSDYTCDGQNISPPLAIKDVPSDAETLALIVEDPDAPSGDWVHWLVWNLPPDSKVINENEVSFPTVVGLNDFGHQSYGGPCPPSGVHRYRFILFALDSTLDLPNTADKNVFRQTIKNHVINQTTLTGLYHRT